MRSGRIHKEAWFDARDYALYTKHTGYCVPVEMEIEAISEGTSVKISSAQIEVFVTVTSVSNDKQSFVGKVDLVLTNSAKYGNDYLVKFEARHILSIQDVYDTSYIINGIPTEAAFQLMKMKGIPVTKINSVRGLIKHVYKPNKI